jgi:hypothetical protein
MRFSYTFVEAMLKLWDSGLQHRAPNGCEPRWLQLVSDSCAPVQSCKRVHRALATIPGTSVLEAHPCLPGEGECLNRWPASGWPVGSKYPPVDNPCSEVLAKAPRDEMGSKPCREWIENRTMAGYNQSSVAHACSFDTVEARQCAKTCCLRQTFDPLAALDQKSAKVQQPFWKASQWSTLWYEHAKHLVKAAPAQYAIWNGSFVPDEHFAVNNLVVADLPFYTHGLTYVVGYEWLVTGSGTSDGAHAITVNCTAELGGDDALALTMAFENSTLMRMNGRIENENGAKNKRRRKYRRKLFAQGACDDDLTDCHVVGSEIEGEKSDTDAAKEAIGEMVGNLSNASSLKQYPNFMTNAAVLGRAFGRKFPPGCSAKLVQHQRSLKEGGPWKASSTSWERTAETAFQPCNSWVLSNVPTPKYKCNRTRPLFIGGGEGKTGTTTLWYTLASLGLVAAHDTDVLRCNAHAIDKPLVPVFNDQAPNAHGQCHEKNNSARDPVLSEKYKEVRNMLFDPTTDYETLDWCSLFEDYDAILDTPIPNLLPFIYQAFGSAAKVIMTVRDAEEWAIRRREWSADWANHQEGLGDPTPLAWMSSGHVGGHHVPGAGAIITNVSAVIAQWFYVASVALIWCLVRPADLLVIDYFGDRGHEENSVQIEYKIREFVETELAAAYNMTRSGVRARHSGRVRPWERSARRPVR